MEDIKVPLRRLYKAAFAGWIEKVDLSEFDLNPNDIPVDAIIDFTLE